MPTCLCKQATQNFDPTQLRLRNNAVEVIDHLLPEMKNQGDATLQLLLKLYRRGWEKVEADLKAEVECKEEEAKRAREEKAVAEKLEREAKIAKAKADKEAAAEAIRAEKEAAKVIEEANAAMARDAKARAKEEAEREKAEAQARTKAQKEEEAG